MNLPLRSRFAVVPRLLLLTILAVPIACRSAAPPPAVASVAPDRFDFPALLGGPPADDSPSHRAELDVMLAAQSTRTPADVARCRSEERVTAFTAFAPVLGPWFDPDQLPATRAVMASAYARAKAASDAAKHVWNRKRPPECDDRIHPCVPFEYSPSFPSGHATRGVVWATLLSTMFPDHRDALMARGREVGTDRWLAGMHWPTDVAAGQTLGAEVARRLLADPAYRAAVDRAAAECRDHRH